MELATKQTKLTDIISQDDLEHLRNDLSQTGELDTATPYYDKLYQHYAFGGLGFDGMPQEVAQGQTGDPDQWIFGKLYGDYRAELNL